ncbi:MAG: cytochrome c-type biogenesis protein CcmH [Halioglobus sp.]
MNRTSLLLVIAVAMFAAPALALIETYDFSDPELEVRYQSLTQELRCPKCQNQNIADSNAPISQDLRKLLHQQLEAGESDDEILDHMVARYGEFVRYRPSFGGVSIVLWLAPALLLLAAFGVLLLTLRSKSRATTAGVASLSAEEQARLASLLNKVGQDS